MKKKNAKNRKRTAAIRSTAGLGVRELWIGFSHVCLHWARLSDCQRCQIVNQSSQARVYRGPLRIHLCGNYTMLRDWPDIFQALKAVEACGDKVEWVEHP
jgi:hypothetical protein